MNDKNIDMLASWTLVLTVAACQLGRAAEPRHVALPILQHEQLFLDDYVIEKMENVTRRVNAVVKRPQPVMALDDGDHGYIRPLTVIHDDEAGLYKMWYLAAMGSKYARGEFKTFATAYATSKDGVTWEKPALGLKRDRETGADTNWVMWATQQTGPNPEPNGPLGKFCFACSITKDPMESDPGRRYKAAILTVDRVNPKKSLGTAVSPDGIHWKSETELANLTMTDLGHMVAEPWDKSPTKMRYLFYGRSYLTYQESIRGDWVKWSHARAVKRYESTDFVKWPNGETVLAADTQDEPETQIYSMAVFPYEGVYIGLANLYCDTSGHMFVQLAVSRNTYRFTRVEPRMEFIPRGEDGSWDFGCIVVDDGPVVVGDEMRFYFGGQSNRHDGGAGARQRIKESRAGRSCSIGLGTIKRGRFVALQAGSKEGIVRTRLLAIEGSELSLNANAANGRIQVGLLDERGQPIPGYVTTVQGIDNISVPVTFGKNTLEPLRNRAVMIQFRLTDAQLYGFRVSGGKMPPAKLAQ